MSRLPEPGSDDGVWGDILNDFLGVSHQGDGKLLASAVTLAGAYTKPGTGIPKTDLTTSVQTSLDNADTAISTKANDSAVVHNTGTEIIAGAKTFNTTPALPLGSALASTTITAIQQITAAGYAALTTPDPTTLYVVVD